MLRFYILFLLCIISLCSCIASAPEASLLGRLLDVNIYANSNPQCCVSNKTNSPNMILLWTSTATHINYYVPSGGGYVFYQDKNNQWQPVQIIPPLPDLILGYLLAQSNGNYTQVYWGVPKPSVFSNAPQAIGSKSGYRYTMLYIKNDSVLNVKILSNGEPYTIIGNPAGIDYAGVDFTKQMYAL